MIKIVERKSGRGSLYFTQVFDNNKIVSEREITYRYFSKPIGNITYYILYDNDMIPVDNVFNYVNDMAGSENTKIAAMQALKQLFIYETVILKDISDFDERDLKNLNHFLKGISPRGGDIRLELTSKRSHETVNLFLSVYRSYLLYRGIDKGAIFQTKRSKPSIVTGELIPTKKAAYRSSEKVPSQKEVAAYISVKEFITIIEIVRKEYTKREECIIRLMYQCGLRLGEAIGLTLDDMQFRKFNGKDIPVAIIRNRVSDRKDQLAKTCMKVNSVEQYSTKEYQTKDFGFQVVPAPDDLFDLISDYVDGAHTTARTKYRDTYFKTVVADRSDKDPKDTDQNYYIFLNSRGNRLSSHSWNICMRHIFREAGIAVDKDKKKHNLNHRFRHGFAMFNVQYSKCGELELKERMRHGSVQSTAVYFKPTIDDSIRLKERYEEELYKIIPQLKI